VTEGLRRSVTCVVAAADIRHFSSFTDFLQLFVARGAVRSWEDLLTNKPELVHDILFEWYRQGQIACQYAAFLADIPKTAGWLSDLVPSSFDVGVLNDRIDGVAGKCEALQLVFPGVTTAEQAASLVVTLCTSDRWTCYEGAWDYSEYSECIPVSLRWSAMDGSYTSWVLGIAPFDPMPFTRRFVDAPFTTLVFRPAPAGKRGRRTDPVLGKDAAHLAHMDDCLGPDQGLRRLFEKMTRSERRKLLVNDLQSVARAQVTFALPSSCRTVIEPALTGKARAKASKSGA
jgi:hypothetical protein